MFYYSMFHKRKTFLVFRHFLEPFVEILQACIFRIEFKLQIFIHRTTFSEQASAHIRFLQPYVLRSVGRVQKRQNGRGQTKKFNAKIKIRKFKHFDWSWKVIFFGLWEKSEIFDLSFCETSVEFEDKFLWNLKLICFRMCT